MGESGGESNLELGCYGRGVPPAVGKGPGRIQV